MGAWASSTAKEAREHHAENADQGNRQRPSWLTETVWFGLCRASRNPSFNYQHVSCMLALPVKLFSPDARIGAGKRGRSLCGALHKKMSPRSNRILKRIIFSLFKTPHPKWGKGDGGLKGKEGSKAKRSEAKPSEAKSLHKSGYS